MLVILLLFSVVAVGHHRVQAGAFRKVEKQTAQFLEVFRKSAKFSDVQSVCASLVQSPLVGMFQAGYAELNAQLRQSSAAPVSPGAPAPRPTLKSLAAVDRALLRASSAEVNKLEKSVTFLATTASITPFIGLFGTVWGIMTAFIEHRLAGLDRPGRGRARHCRSADCHGRWACSRPFRPSTSTITSPRR